MTYNFYRFIIRRGIKKSTIRRSWLNRALGGQLVSPDLWHFNRKSVLKAWIIGIICAGNPFIGIQSYIGLPLALIFRANVFIILLMVLSTNPITIGPIMAFSYWLMCTLLGISADNRIDFTNIVSDFDEKSFGEVFSIYGEAFMISLYGMLVIDAVLIVVGSLVIHYFPSAWIPRRKKHHPAAAVP